MIITKENTRRAVAKCRARRPHVRFFRADETTATYAVSRTDGTETTVTFFLDSQNRKCATCRCQAGLRGMMCYHVVAAIALHSARVRGNPAARLAQPHTAPPADAPLHLAAPPFESETARAIAAMDSYFSDEIRAKARQKWEAARAAARHQAQANAARRRAADEAHERETYNVRRTEPQFHNGLML